MAKNYGHYKELGVTIPSDLNPQEWVLYTVCAPKDQEWRLALYSAVRLLARGRFWLRDSRELSIKQAQEIGRQIEMSFNSCDISLVVDSVDALTAMLQGELVGIKQAIAGINGCCDLTAAPLPDEVQLEVGDPPATYGNQATNTWDEYEQYLCGSAHQWVNGMIAAMREFEDIVEAGAFIIGGVAVVLSILSSPAVGLLIAVSWSTAAAIFTALLDFASGQTISDVADFLVEHETDLANIIVCAKNPEAAAVSVRSYLTAGLTVAEYQAIKYFDIEGDMARLYAGVNRNGDPIEATLSTDCFPCEQADVYIQEWDNSGAVNTYPLYELGEVQLTALRSDAYGPFADFRFVDFQGTPINVTATNYQIVALNGWQQHNIPQHPFTIQTLNSAAGAPQTDIAIDSPIPLPWTFQRASSPSTMGIIQIASDVGTGGFTVTIKRLA